MQNISEAVNFFFLFLLLLILWIVYTYHEKLSLMLQG